MSLVGQENFLSLFLLLLLSTFSAAMLWCPLQPPCAITCINICAHLKNPTLAAIPVFGHMKTLHTLTGMGSAALVAAVPCPGKVTQTFHRGL